GLLDYYWSTCKPTSTLKAGETRWAVGYPGVTWGSTAGKMNSKSQQNLKYNYFYAEYESFRSDHIGGVNFAFVGGSVRYLSEDIDFTIYQALSTRAGEEPLDKVDF